jgi:predicted Zn-dependent peptidase
MYPSVHLGHPDFYAAMAGVSVLSGGMGSRLFTEVREKRGLCYAVGASYQSAGRMGAVRCYLGASPEQAQEALDVMVHELVHLRDGVTREELDRAKVGLRSGLIMAGEASEARAARCTSDYFNLGRVRTLEEIEAEIATLNVERVLAHLNAHPPAHFAVTTLGPTELRVDTLN